MYNICNIYSTYKIYMVKLEEISIEHAKWYLKKNVSLHSSILSNWKNKKF